MRDSWLRLVDSILRPARPHLERCLQERERHLTARRQFSEERSRAIADCERRIESARADVFAANNGVIGWRMGALEREWRLLSRPDPDAGLMDLWARIAPARWIDRKRWRDSDAADRLGAAVHLAADPAGVEAAESAVRSLHVALLPWGAPIGSRARWRSFGGDSDPITELLPLPLRAAREAVSRSDAEPVILERARRLDDEVREATLARFPDRPMLARGLGHAAFVDFLFRAARFTDGHRPNPVESLRELWATGYVLTTFDTFGATLEIAAQRDRSDSYHRMGESQPSVPNHGAGTSTSLAATV
jgi:hypothetical protein